MNKLDLMVGTLIVLIGLGAGAALPYTEQPQSEPAPTLEPSTTGRVGGVDNATGWRDGSLEETLAPLQAVGLEIAGEGMKEYRQVFVVPGESVGQVMMRAKELGLAVETRDYGGKMGLLIEGINGIRNDPRAGSYWTLYINGGMSMVGASSATVKPGDRIEWRYENLTEN